MCLGVPGLIVEREPPENEFASAVVEFSGLRRRVSVALVPDAAAGDYVIVHAGVAITRLDADAADRILRELASLGNDDGWGNGATP
jgi:hydrogenase expression/formation protein HypC